MGIAIGRPLTCRGGLAPPPKGEPDTRTAPAFRNVSALCSATPQPRRRRRHVGRRGLPWRLAPRRQNRLHARHPLHDDDPPRGTNGRPHRRMASPVRLTADSCARLAAHPRGKEKRATRPRSSPTERAVPGSTRGPTGRDRPWSASNPASAASRQSPPRRNTRLRTPSTPACSSAVGQRSEITPNPSPPDRRGAVAGRNRP
ncbi:predicted protein [Streptomyces sp. AA4]|nr:predicted protein [Streptomyces sp. AA4]